ncbi:UNVERIFIED_CONTAM: flagellar hook-length control protein FliK [Acetivibrio alkalicellulosi]
MKIAQFLEGQLNVSSKTDILSSLKIGDVLRAKVLETTKDTLIIKLTDGTLINAATMTDIDVKNGEYVDFVVKNNIDGQIFLETLKNTTQKSIDGDKEINKELLELGIKGDKRAIDIAKQIKSNDVSVDKNFFDKVIDTLEKYDNLSIDKAVYLLSKNILPIEKNISSLNQIVDEKYKIGDEINKLFNELISIEHEETNILLEKHLKSSAHKKTHTKTEKSYNLDSINEELKSLDISPENKSIYEKVFKSIDINKFDFENIKELIHYVKDNVSVFFNDSDKDFEAIIKNLIKKSSSVNESLNQKKNNDILKENSKNEVIKNIFDKFFININKDSKGHELNVKNTYTEIYKEIEIIKDVINQSEFLGKGEIIDKIDNIQNNLRFLNELNNHNTYIQIPLNFFNNKHTGELYILKRNGGKKNINRENTSVFLSLNTLNLGQVDTLINLNKKNITLNISAKTTEMINFIKENYAQLYNTLLEKGYKVVDIRYRILEDSVNILNVNNIAEKESKTQKLDYKI